MTLSNNPVISPAVDKMTSFNTYYRYGPADLKDSSLIKNEPLRMRGGDIFLYSDGPLGNPDKPDNPTGISHEYFYSFL